MVGEGLGLEVQETRRVGELATVSSRREQVPPLKGCLLQTDPPAGPVTSQPRDTGTAGRRHTPGARA